MNHSPDCVQHQLAQSQLRFAWRQHWHNYCERCDATGSIATHDTIGGYELWYDVSCPACMDDNRCPRCGFVQSVHVFNKLAWWCEDRAQWMKSTNPLKWWLFNWADRLMQPVFADGLKCQKCGWNWGAVGDFLPEAPECICLVSQQNGEYND